MKLFSMPLYFLVLINLAVEYLLISKLRKWDLKTAGRSQTIKYQRGQIGKKSFVCMEGKSMTPQKKNIFKPTSNSFVPVLDY